MAGIIDGVMPRVIGARTHGIIDYIHAGTNFAAAALFRKSNRAASNAALALGAGVLVNALMTDYPLGVFRTYGFKTHGLLDYGVAAGSAAVSMLPGIKGTTECRYFYAQGLAETLVAALTDYSDRSGSREVLEHSDSCVAEVA